MTRALAVVVAVVVAVLVAPAPVAAAGELQLSRDGRSWADHLDEPLFDDAVALVPGGRATAVFHVRNASDGAAELRLAVIAAEAAGLDPAPLRIEVAVTPSSGGPASSSAIRTFAAARTTPDFGIAEPMAAGTSRRVAVTLHLDAAAGNEAQRRSFSFALEVRLRDAVAVVPGGPGRTPTPAPALPAVPPSSSPTRLSRTGLAIGGTVALAAAMVAAGVVVRVFARCRRPVG